MVEGLGCKIKGEKIKFKLMKQVVKVVLGNVVDRVRKFGLKVCQYNYCIDLVMQFGKFKKFYLFI